MKRLLLINLIGCLLIGALWSIKSFAGPPKGAKQLMIPYHSICTSGMTEMMAALTTDYAVHISMTFEENPTAGIVVVHNPDTNTAAVLHVREDRTCLVFSGQNLKMFDRPEGMAPPIVELDDFK